MDSIDLETVKTWALVLGIGIPVLGIVLALVVKAVVIRVLVLVLCLGIGLAVWTQRAALLDYVESCSGTATFFGVTVTMPQSVQDACESASG